MSAERPPAADDPARPRPPSRWLGELPATVVLAGVALGLAVVALNHFKRGLVLVAASVLLGAVLRLVLPGRRAGMLAVRGRVIDAVVLGVLGVGIAAVTIVAPPPP